MKKIAQYQCRWPVGYSFKVAVPASTSLVDALIHDAEPEPDGSTHVTLSLWFEVLTSIIPRVVGDDDGPPPLFVRSASEYDALSFIVEPPGSSVPPTWIFQKILPLGKSYFTLYQV